MTRLVQSLVTAVLLAPALAPAQVTTTTTTQVGVPPSLQVSRIAPQLIAFAGGQTNFDTLVNGLASGTPITLTTVLPTGQVQTVNFTPQGTMSVIQIAQTLESARQSLIQRGVATPTGQQVAISLTGGVLTTPGGSVQVASLLPAANQPMVPAPGATGIASPVSTTTTVVNPNGTPSAAALIQGQSSGAGGTTPPSPSQIIQNQRDGNISNTPTIGNISNTPTTSTPVGTTQGTTSTTTTTTAPATAPATVAPATTAPRVGAAPR